MIKALMIAAAYFAAAITASAQTPTPAASPQPNSGADQAQIDQGLIVQGKTTFAQKCSHCHGPNMVTGGTVAPDLRGFPDDKARFLTTVKAGKNGRMPPWADILSDDQLTELWAYVSSRRNP
jgi:mono/diheme cytochrome c family protein